MGKKAVPLRKLFAQKAAESGSSDRSSLGKRRRAVPTYEPSNKKDQKKSKKGKTSDNDDSVDWELLEKQQQEEDMKGDADSEGDDSDSGDEDGDGIRLDGSLEHEVEDYTFEFNDMRSEYAEGITTMLRKFIANPTEAYNLATVVTSQSKIPTIFTTNNSFDFTLTHANHIIIIYYLQPLSEQ